MGVMDVLSSLIRWSPMPLALPQSLGDASVESTRVVNRGRIQSQVTSETRWYLEDIERAEHEANAGNLCTAARMFRSARADGVLSGVLSTRTDGLVRLPRKFRGRMDVVRRLTDDHAYARTDFDELCPAAEIGAMVADGIALGVSVAELVWTTDRAFPSLVRLDPEFLLFRWAENQWYYRSAAGMLPIYPGNGRWVLHCPGGVIAPWLSGAWRALCTSYVRKSHAQLSKDAWESTLANPARVAVSPAGASEHASDSWLQSVIDWGRSTVFGIRPGYDIKLVESNGRGYECFLRTIESENNAMVTCLAGQTVTTDGGAGFANASIHAAIRSDLIKATADALAYTVNTQVLPYYFASVFGANLDTVDLSQSPQVEWDVTPATDRTREAAALQTTASAIGMLIDSLSKAGLKPDVRAIAAEYGIPLSEPATSPQATLSLISGGQS
jgi:hypothetical protein